jgi:hypothetical protein
MARTTYTVDNPAKAPTGGNVTKRTGDTANGHYVANSGNTRLLVVNTGVASATVYVWPGGTPNGANQAVASATSTGNPVGGLTPLVQPVVLAAAGSAGDAKLLGPFPQSVYTSTLYFDPASGTTVNFYAVEV